MTENNSFDGLIAKAKIFLQNNDYKNAKLTYLQLHKLYPDFFDIKYHLGELSFKLKEYLDVIYYFEYIKINYPAKTDLILEKLLISYFNVAKQFQDIGDCAKSIKFYQKYLEIKKDDAFAHSNLADMYINLNQKDLALKHLELSAKLQPNNYKILFNFANLLNEVGQKEKAILIYKKSYQIQSDPMVYSYLVHSLQEICDWQQLEDYLKLDNQIIVPFINISTFANEEKNYQAAKIWSDLVDGSIKNIQIRKNVRQKKTDSKIKLGYLSNRFNDCATMHLLGDLFAKHDRNKFIVNLYSYSVDDNSKYREKAVRGADKFIDITNYNFLDAAQKIADDEIDILINLNGWSFGAREEIAFLRPAPIQITYLVYPGTIGSRYYDYIIADKHVIPDDAKQYYTEEPLYMDHCYQINDDSQEISDKIYKREDFNLPKDKFIYGCFNQSFKITKEIFDIWLEILNVKKDSILWLLDMSQLAKNNILSYCDKNNFDRSRIFFAPKLKKAEHLSRCSLIDLALDTNIYGGHTTTSDMLWAGVPVICYDGKHFASRVSSSIIKNINLEELIAHNFVEYKEKILFFSEKNKINELKNKIKLQKKSSNLFNSDQYIKNLENKLIKLQKNL